jgi:hypothetical protein
MAQTGLMSELDAVNKILAVAGDSPVQTLGDNYIQSNLARQVLTRASRKVQSNGWWFNEEEGVILVPAISGFITLGTNVISAVANDDAGSVIQRGNRLYDRRDRTYTFTQNLSVDIILALEWDELPQVAREYISDVACTQYNNDFFGAQEIRSTLQKNEDTSYLILKQEDLESRDVSMFSNTRAYNIAFRNRR